MTPQDAGPPLGEVERTQPVWMSKSNVTMTLELLSVQETTSSGAQKQPKNCYRKLSRSVAYRSVLLEVLLPYS
jgi:hypothetical protein